MPQEHIVHYLGMAYLIEISIVFNIAYMEVKRKRAFESLLYYLSVLATGSTEGKINIPRPFGGESKYRESVCKLTKCSDCNGDEVLERYEEPDFRHISKMLTALCFSGSLWTEPLGEKCKRVKLVWKAFAFSGIFRRLRYFPLYYFIRLQIDRYLAALSLTFATFCVIVFTMADFGIDIVWLHPLHSIGLWAHQQTWINWSIFFLFLSVIMAPIFWISWEPLLQEVDCLGTSMSIAYEKKKQGWNDPLTSPPTNSPPPPKDGA